MIDALFAQILYEPWFRIFLAVALLLAVGTPLMIFRLVKTSPEGFSPTVRVSGIDLLQAWKLGQTASKQSEAGQFNAAVFTWRMAIANNPSDADAVRALLRLLADAERPKAYAEVSIPYSRWLLRLSGTNRSDLELAVKLYEQVGAHDLIVALGSHSPRQIEGKFAVAYLKALFHQGAYKRFSEVWEQTSAKLGDRDRAVAELYHTAYLVAFADGPAKTEATQKLERALNDPELWGEAHRLNLYVCNVTADAAGYQRSLERLGEAGLDTFSDHLGYWNLLLRLGRGAEALALCAKSGRPPQEADQAVLLAEFNHRAGRPEDALRVLEHYREVFPESDAIWISRCNLLIHLERWDELRGAAVQARATGASTRNWAAAYAYYFEGLAQFQEHRVDAVERSFLGMAERSVGASQRLELAERVLYLGFPVIAEEMLTKRDDGVQAELEANLSYWTLLAQIAHVRRSEEQLVQALTRAHQLAPGDTMICNNFAAALLSVRRDHERALALTTEVLKGGHAWPGARVNHALALNLNGRVEQAVAMLETVRSEELSAPEQTAYQLARFEIALARHDWAVARQAASLVRTEDLLPTLVRAFAEKRRLLANSVSE